MLQIQLIRHGGKYMTNLIKFNFVEADRLNITFVCDGYGGFIE